MIQKRLLWSMIFMMVLILFGCQKQEITYEQGLMYLKTGGYDQALEIFETLLEINPEHYEAWYGIIECYIQLEGYTLAEAHLKSLKSLILERYQPGQEDSYMREIINRFDRTAEMLKTRQGSIGSWYEPLRPGSLDLRTIDFSVMDYQDQVRIDYEGPYTIHYNVTGEAVTLESSIYETGILLPHMGGVTLSVALFNDYGIKGDDVQAYITVVDKGNPPIPSLMGDHYNHSQVLFLTGYRSDYETVYYVLDGSDPKQGMVYSPDYGILLPVGQHAIRAIIYNWNTQLYSRVLEMSIAIGDLDDQGFVFSSEPIVLTVALLNLEEGIQAGVVEAMRTYEAIYTNVSLQIGIYDNVEALIQTFERGQGPDLVYGFSGYAKDLYQHLGDVGRLYNLRPTMFLEGVLPSVYYWDAHYTLPVSVRPMKLLHYHKNYVLMGDGTQNMTYEQVMGSAGRYTHIPLLFMDGIVSGMDLMAYYYGYGGQVDTVLGYVTLEKEPMVQALEAIKTLQGAGFIRYVQETGTQSVDDFEHPPLFWLEDPIVVAQQTTEYEIIGHMPLPKAYYATYPMRVQGIMVHYPITQNPTSSQAAAIIALYDIMLAIGPKAQGLYAPIKTGEQANLTMTLTPAFSMDLHEILTQYVSVEGVIEQVLVGSLSPEVGAERILAAIRQAYKE